MSSYTIKFKLLAIVLSFSSSLQPVYASCDKIEQDLGKSYVWSVTKKLGVAPVRAVQKNKGKIIFVLLLATGWIILEYSNMPSEEDSKYKALYDYAKKDKVYINSRVLGAELAAIFQEFENDLSDPHNKYPALVGYLSGGGAYYQTGNERELKAWVLSQEDNSIGIEKIFRQSLEINSGSLGDALLCTHELLRNEARFKSDYIRYNSSDAEQKKFFNKFVDIRGDLAEIGGGGDHPGSWYRFFGVLLKVYADSVSSDAITLSYNARSAKWLQDSILVTAAEKIKPVIRWPERDLKKAQFNRMAVSTGFHLVQGIVENQKK